jgi:hypothetical protein
LTRGGYHPGCGRKHRDTVTVQCRLLRPVFNELLVHEKASGVYRCQIAAKILTEHLVNGIVERELAACSCARPLISTAHLVGRLVQRELAACPLEPWPRRAQTGQSRPPLYSLLWHS